MDIDRLREDLEDYYGSAISANPFAMGDLINVQMASDEELINIASENNFDLSDYEEDYPRRRR